ncbi:hypothetical protein [Lysinibacillus sp. Ag94]|uniref:hypothetical protein n=1 Tax=Lysinibacillus sp. Ag94 TaxID=2936682 RepID=UPI00200EED87|nr:hypothetical protein [Lysinibacillus sp. Ag94]UPW84805.1 hypothetical protein MY533_08125 [Lysinibacillus sp. Ag94]
MMDFHKIKDAVNSMEMSKAMENRLKMNDQDAKREKSSQINFQKWGTVASVFGILMVLLIGLPFINKYGDSQTGNFTITVYADDSIGHELLKAKTTIDLSTIDRVDVLNSISGDGRNLIFTDIMLNVSGENIDFIQYEINEGIFIEDVTLTKEEVNNREKLLLEKINYITNEPNSEIFQAIKEIGSTFTVKYNEQEQFKYSLAIPPYDTIEGDIQINVTVTYTDGTSEQQDMIINQESDSISLMLK